LGSTLADWSNWWYQFELGRWVIRQGTTMQGAIGNLNGLYDYTDTVYGSVWGEYRANRTWIATDPVNGLRVMNYQQRVFQADTNGNVVLGREGQAEILLEPGTQSIQFKTGGVVQSAIDGATRTIYGFERLGRPLGPEISWGPIADPGGDPALERMGFNIRDASERFIGMWSGNNVNPADAGMRVGAQGAAHFFQFSGGKISWAGENASLSEEGVFTASNAVLSGTITANTGAIGGWTIGATSLTANSVTLNSDGYLALGTGNNVVKLYAAGTWRIAAGHATLSSAPFRVAQDGSMYADRVHIVAGDTTINNDGITLRSGDGLETSKCISWAGPDGTPRALISTLETGSILYLYAPELHLFSPGVRIGTGPTNELAFFGKADGSTQRSYIASPTAAQIRDIFIAFGLMAAS
jgi:hypothetical protein